MKFIDRTLPLKLENIINIIDIIISYNSDKNKRITININVLSCEITTRRYWCLYSKTMHFFVYEHYVVL